MESSRRKKPGLSLVRRPGSVTTENRTPSLHNESEQGPFHRTYLFQIVEQISAAQRPLPSPRRPLRVFCALLNRQSAARHRLNYHTSVALQNTDHTSLRISAAVISESALHLRLPTSDETARSTRQDDSQTRRTQARTRSPSKAAPPCKRYALGAAR